ncbi:MAG: enoyl-CoA hydratase/isomerase family protein [Pseudomonadales bacterium]
MSYQKLLLEKDGPITTLTLNRPESHNALDKALSDELNVALRSVQRDKECRILVLTGAGNTFCAGDDIKDFMTWKNDDVLRGHDAYWQIRLYQETVQILEDLDAVTISKVDGVCTGGGLELTLVCDFVVATDRSRWGMPEIDWGITPGWGGTSRLARHVGWRKAKEWNLIGALFSGRVAEKHGLINRLCSADDLNTEVDALIGVMLEKNRSTLRRTKFIMNKGVDQHISASLAMEVAIMPYPVDVTGFRSDEASISDFQTKQEREWRRAKSKHFWQETAR